MNSLELYKLMFYGSDNEILNAISVYDYKVENFRNSINIKYPTIPLHQAISARRTKVIEILLNNKKNNINVVDDYKGYYPLHCISEIPNIILKLLDLEHLTNYGSIINKLEDVSNSVYIEMVKEVLINNIINFKEADIIYLDKKIKTEEVNIAKILIDRGCNINALDNHNFTPLHIAVSHKMWNIINLLIYNDANVSLMAVTGDTAFEHGIKSISRLSDIKKLLYYYNMYKCKVTLKPCNVKNYKNKILKYLISSGIIDVNSVDEYNRTLLHYIVDTKNYNTINLLIDNGASINAKDVKDETPLHKSIITDASIHVVKTCLNAGAEVNAVDIFNRTPLYYALDTKHNIKIIKLLLDNGANINIRDKYDSTPLHKASSINSSKGYKIVNLLLSRGADINAKNIYGVTPLHKSVMVCGRTSLIRTLIKHGADVNAKDMYGRTPLHEVSNCCNISYYIIKMLLQNGAEIDARDNNGNTPIYTALHEEKSLRAFVSNGSRINIVNNMGVSPLERLLESNHLLDKYIDYAKIMIPKIVLESYIDSTNDKTGLYKNIEKINISSELKVFEENCKNEIKLIKNMKIGNYYLDIFFKSDNIILLNNLSKKINTVNPYLIPIYYSYLITYIEKIRKRYVLIQSSINKMDLELTNSYWSLLPTEIKYSIFSHLDINHLLCILKDK
ncbi:SWPV1-193 [Shearwaterpox virus]|uniref:SWPV1-193 n=1 Tax=Shearwaterpox virus TaxID=1974596 RepID=A0A1V0S820_CNPV|nr:SWPV1-193 [Shearwaterpox virus]